MRRPPFTATLPRCASRSTRSQGEDISQLLDTARRCFEGQEYQLALQKVQDVLNLDSTNTEARSLQGEIENKRSSDQIEDWCRIALQHLENHSYGHARDALQNVLNLSPKETRAQQLMLEVDRREQEYIRLRQEKEQFYKAALNAHADGRAEFGSHQAGARSRMDRRAPDTFAPDRAAMYQKLYNDVRSQHDLLDRGYAEARRFWRLALFGRARFAPNSWSNIPNTQFFAPCGWTPRTAATGSFGLRCACRPRSGSRAGLGRRIAMLEEALNAIRTSPSFRDRCK